MISRIAPINRTPIIELENRYSNYSCWTPYFLQKVENYYFATMSVLEGDELAARIALADCDIAFGRPLECGFRLDFAAHVARRVSVFLLLKRMRLNDLFNHLSESDT